MDPVLSRLKKFNDLLDQIQLIFWKKYRRMDSIISMYGSGNGRQASQSSSNLSYSTPKSYLDPLKIKYERQKKENKYVKDKSNKKLNMTVKKGIEKRQNKLPSPHSYSPKEVSPRYHQQRVTLKLPSRKTIFAEIDNKAKKFRSPGPFDYSTNKLKSKSTIPFCKSQNINYLDSEISRAVKLPGVGQYQSPRSELGKTLGKWNISKRQFSTWPQKNSTISASSATYSPHKIDKKLFSQMQKLPKKSSIIGKQKRFEENKQNLTKNMFYVGLSQWASETKHKKVDILARLSTYNFKSVYYH